MTISKLKPEEARLTSLALRVFAANRQLKVQESEKKGRLGDARLYERQAKAAKGLKRRIDFEQAVPPPPFA